MAQSFVDSIPTEEAWVCYSHNVSSDTYHIRLVRASTAAEAALEYSRVGLFKFAFAEHYYEMLKAAGLPLTTPPSKATGALPEAWAKDRILQVWVPQHRGPQSIAQPTPGKQGTVLVQEFLTTLTPKELAERAWRATLIAAGDPHGH